jgi:hypothetical protein
MLVVRFEISLWNFNASFYFPFVSPKSILPASIAIVSPRFSFKLYTDVAVYYAALGFVALLALLAHAFPSLRRLLHRRASFRLSMDPFRSLFGWNIGARVAKRDSEIGTVGEWLVLLMIIGLFTFWPIYFTGLDCYELNESSLDMRES